MVVLGVVLRLMPFRGWRLTAALSSQLSVEPGEGDGMITVLFFFFQAEDGIRDYKVTGVQTCALPIFTHGTSTLEETAYFLNLTVKHDRPVVVVGSMRPATALSADGPLNLLNAVRTAASSEARGKGVLVVMNDEINGARDVTKTNTYRVETFRSPELGYLGYVDEDKRSFYRASTKRHTAKSEFDVSNMTQLPKVDI